LFGGVDDTSQDMYDIDQLGKNLLPVDERVQFQPMCSRSVISDKFGEEIKPDPDPDMAEAMLGKRTTRSMLKTAAANETDDVDLDKENEEVRVKVQALQLNKKLVHAEAAERKRKRPKTIAKEGTSRKLDIEINAFDWSYNSTLMIRPTIELFWYNLNRRRGLRL